MPPENCQFLWLLLAAAGLLLCFLLRKTPPFRGQFKYCPGCAHPLEKMVVGGKIRNGCPSCGFVHWDNPVPVAVALIPHGDKLVFVKRKINPGKGKYALPAGFVDPHETPQEAAVREALEETSLKIEIVRLVDVIGLPEQNLVLHFYLAKPVTEEPKPGDEEVEECALATLDSLPGELAFESHRQIIANYYGVTGA